jgi:oligopeptide transport system substrate-binding protein
MRTIRALSITCVLAMLLMAAGCKAAATPPAIESDVTPAPAKLVPATETPLALSSPVPAATARPLSESATEAGHYQNEVLGVSLDYPPSWPVEVMPNNNLEFVIINPPTLPVVVYLDAEYIEEGQDFKDAASDFFQWLQENIELASVSWSTIDPDYQLSGGTPAWKGEGEGVDESTGSVIHFETIAAPRGNYVFLLTILGTSESVDASASRLDDIRQSLRVFSPTPYGVSRENALFLAAGEPQTFDPAKWHFGADSVIGDLFSGLVKLDPSMRPIPDLAESWDVSPDGLIYTFHLRQNVRFHTGRPFTAADVKYSWERACDPATGSDTADTYLGDIRGVRAFRSGEASEIEGITVVDDYTVAVELDEPKAYFLYKLAYVTSWIVDRETVSEIEDNPVGTGPFKMVRHDENALMILARNEYYYRGEVSLEYVVYLIYQGPSLRLYEGGDIDMMYIGEDLLDRAEDPGDLLYGTIQQVSELCTYYVVFDVSQAPFDDALIREAFTKSIDRERYNEIVNEGEGVIAKGLYPPGLPGYNTELQPVEFDMAEAEQALASSSFGSAAALPEIVLTTAGEGTDLSPSDGILIQMWEEALGVSVQVEQIDYQSYMDEIYAGDHGQILTSGWCADYPDPENFADVLFHTGSSQNLSNYSNAALDAMLERARSLQDTTERIALYQEIEQIIVDDMPVAFLVHDSSPTYLLMKPYVQGYQTTPIGIAQLMNVWIDASE